MKWRHFVAAARIFGVALVAALFEFGLQRFVGFDPFFFLVVCLLMDRVHVADFVFVFRLTVVVVSLVVVVRVPFWLILVDTLSLIHC